MKYARTNAAKKENRRFPTFMSHTLRRTSIRTGRRVVVITDNAKYHHAVLHKQWREDHAADFTLDYLPPYSPELNPIERVWKLTRRRCLHNRHFPSLDDVITAVETEFDHWASRNETLRRLCRLLKTLCITNTAHSSRVHNLCGGTNGLAGISIKAGVFPIASRISLTARPSFPITPASAPSSTSKPRAAGRPSPANRSVPSRPS
ncbi:MAG: transposase [Bryobacteraceae bacterium]